MRRPLSVQTVHAWARANGARYAKSNNTEKKRIVDEFQATCGGNRRYLQQLLRNPPPVRQGPIRRPRARQYGEDVRRALEFVWKRTRVKQENSQRKSVKVWRRIVYCQRLLSS